MKLAEVLRAKSVFDNHSRDPMDVRVSYKIFQLVSNINRNAVGFYRERIAGIAEKYGAKLENGNFKVTEDKRDGFFSEMRDLENVDVEIPDIKFSLEELGAVKLSVSDIAALKDFIVEE